MVFSCGHDGVSTISSACTSKVVLFCCILTIVIAPTFLASTQYKAYLLDFWRDKACSLDLRPAAGNADSYIADAKTGTHAEWPISTQFWKRLSGSDRAPPDHCPSWGCSVEGPSKENRSSGFAYPFDAKDTCPFHFRFIHEDLAPWAKLGITKEMLENKQSVSQFRLIIKRGRLYVDAYVPCFQTRSIFTIWGILQLLDYYPGLVPDVDMLFGCGDVPRVSKASSGLDSASPPVFRYCTTAEHLDVPFPDWSFWGWPEVNLKPWEDEMNDLLRGQNDVLWEHRHPLAFWRGNTDTGGPLRKNLLKCHGPSKGAEIQHQNWGAERKATFKQSRLAQQCNHRYKVYVEGWGWSVSLKYILGCDSPVLLVDPRFHDFFSRGLMPLQHYWPINPRTLCKSIKLGVDWGNNSTYRAELLGRTGSRYAAIDLSMKRVYDYMLHALHEYAKLLRFEPDPRGSFVEMCSEVFLCQAPPNERPLYEASKVTKRSDTPPCFLPPREEAVVRRQWQTRRETTNFVRKAEEGRGSFSNISARMREFAF